MFRTFFGKNEKSKKEGPRVVCIGSSTKDIFFPISEGKIFDTPEDILSQKKIAFEVGAKYQSADRFESLGGCAANVSVGLSKLNIQSSCYTKIGKDLSGKWIMEQLEINGVSTEFVMIDDCKSDLSAIIVDTRSGERVIFSNRDANEKLEIFENKFIETDWVFVSSLNGDWGSNIRKIIDICENRSIKIAFNPGQKNIKDNAKVVLELISKSEVVFVNKDEAIEILSSVKKIVDEKEINKEEFILRELEKFCKGTIVLTDGHRGGWIISNGKIFHAPAKISQAIDSTGAGDSFTSAFLSGCIKDMSVVECMKRGIVNSSNVVKYYGAIEGLLSEKEIKEICKNIQVEEIK